MVWKLDKGCAAVLSRSAQPDLVGDLSGGRDAGIVSKKRNSEFHRKDMVFLV